jgi:hypothetical protein
MNQAFSNSRKDPLTAAAASILFNEDLSTVKDKISKLKVGDKTNFGIVKAISDTSIEFKARDTGVTKIALNQRKMGSKDFVLDKLMKLKEDAEDQLTEGILGGLLKKAAMSIASPKALADGWYDGANSGMNKLKSGLSHDNVEKFMAASLALARVRDEAAAMKSAKDTMAFLGDAAKIEALIKKHAEEILKKGVLNMKEDIDDSQSIEEGASPALVKRAEKIGWSKKVVDDMWKLFMSNPGFDENDVKELISDAIEYQEKKKKNESVEELEETELEEGMQMFAKRKYPDAVYKGEYAIVKHGDKLTTVKKILDDGKLGPAEKVMTSLLSITSRSVKEETELEEAEIKKPIEAYGVKGMKSTKWRKTFKSLAELEKWADANDAEVIGISTD